MGKVTRYRGETIMFDITGTGTLDLDAVDFVVYVYKDMYRRVCKMLKEDLKVVSANHYRCVLPATMTATMMQGDHTVEVYIKAPEKLIAKIPCAFAIEDSMSKKDAGDE